MPSYGVVTSGADGPWRATMRDLHGRRATGNLVSVEGTGPFNFGDFHDESEDAVDDDVAQPMWLPPEDRLWRHPSEVAEHGRPQGRAGPVLPLRTLRREHRFTVTAGVVGAAAVATAVVVAFSLTSSPEVATTARTVVPAQETSFVTVPSGITAPLVVKMMEALRPSLISIRPADGKGSGHMTGIVLPGGNLAVTAAAAVGKATRVEIVTSTGQHRQVSVLGSDTHSGIAVVSTGGGLTPASFADGNVTAGELAIAACLCGSAVAAADPAAAAVGEVRKVGSAATLKSGAGLVDTIEADMPLGHSPWGGVLMNGQGQVVGVLDARESVASGRAGVFVPSSLAVAVAQDLATTHTVEHGWLGIKCTDAPDGGGAKITTIMAGSPAATAGLHQGDVVEAVDAEPVSTLADLQASLYTSPPGTAVSVLLDRAGRDVSATLTLAGSPTG
jgi:putative serine protease PepD